MCAYKYIQVRVHARAHTHKYTNTHTHKVPGHQKIPITEDVRKSKNPEVNGIVPLGAAVTNR